MGTTLGEFLDWFGTSRWTVSPFHLTLGAIGVLWARARWAK